MQIIRPIRPTMHPHAWLYDGMIAWLHDMIDNLMAALGLSGGPNFICVKFLLTRSIKPTMRPHALFGFIAWLHNCIIALIWSKIPLFPLLRPRIFSIRIFWAINRPQNRRYWEGRPKKRSFWPVFGPLNPLNEKCARPHYPGSIPIFNTHLLSYRPSSKSPVSYHFVAILAKYGYFWVSPRKFEILYSFFFRSLETWNIKYIAFGIAIGIFFFNHAEIANVILHFLCVIAI